MNKIILDTSYLLACLLPDEKVPDVKLYEKIIAGEIDLFEPHLFSVEVANGLRNCLLAKRLDRKLTGELLDTFLELENVEYIFDLDYQAILELSLKENLSVYDAVYLWLRKETGYPLYSLDSRLSNLS